MTQITKEGHCRAFMEVVGGLKLFDYQVNFINDCINNKRVVGLFSRQSGKTTIISFFATWKALQKPNQTILIIAPTDRQAGELFNRLRNAAESSSIVKSHIANTTLREMRFTNGSLIRAMPTGDSGDNIRGQTADLIILEESSYIKSAIVNQVIMPMIAATDGDIIQIGTPFYKNHFYKAYEDPNYKVHQYDYTHCPLISENFIKEQRDNLTGMEFTMEYMAQFIDESDNYFTSELVNACVDQYEFIPEDQQLHPKSRFYLGVDFARLGQDKSVFIIIEEDWQTDVLKVIYIEETHHKLLTDAIGRVQHLNNRFKFTKIYLDETGLGAGPSDVLRERIGHVIEPITFTMKSKQDIYSNLKSQMENGRVRFPPIRKLIAELLDLKYEFSESGNIKIHHSDRGHDDYCDALALAVYNFKPAGTYKPSIGY